MEFIFRRVWGCACLQNDCNWCLFVTNLSARRSWILNAACTKILPFYIWGVFFFILEVFCFLTRRIDVFFFRTCLRRTGPDVRVTFSRLTACFRSHLRGWCYSGVGPSFHPLPSLPPPPFLIHLSFIIPPLLLGVSREAIFQVEYIM